MLQFQATILMALEFTPPMVKSRCSREDREHEETVARPRHRRCRPGTARRIGDGISICRDFPPVARESLMPQVIGWEAKNAWAKCDGAIGGTRQRSHLTSEQRTSLATAIRRLPGCGDP
jgi:hypothetical protein